MSSPFRMMIEEQDVRMTEPVHSFEVTFILDRTTLESDERKVLKELFLPLDTWPQWCLTVTPKHGDADTAPAAHMMCDAIDVDCSMMNDEGTTTLANLKLEVRQESDVEIDQVTVHELPGWTAYALPRMKPGDCDCTAITCLSNVKVIPSLKFMYIKLFVKWKVNGAVVSTSLAAVGDKHVD